VSDLTLLRVTWHDGRPSLDPEDYSVRQDGRNVGRIIARPVVPVVLATRGSFMARAGFGRRRVRMEEDRNENRATAWSDPVKEIVIVCLAIDAETGAIDPTAPFVIISRQTRLQPHRGGVYHNEPDGHRPIPSRRAAGAVRGRMDRWRVELRQARRRCLIGILLLAAEIGIKFPGQLRS